MPDEFIIIMGVSGCGKSTIGETIVEKLDNAVYLEGDELHPQANIEKMSQGTPLTDDDRWPWFDTIIEAAKKHPGKTVFAGCSALKQIYRDYLFGAFKNNNANRIIYLKGDFETIHGRMKKREHFMPASLLESQFETLEEPTGGSKKLLQLSIGKPIADIVNDIERWI